MVKFHVPRCPSRNINPLLELPKLTPILKRNFYSVVDFVLVFQRGYTRVRAIEIQRCASKSQPAAYFVCTFCRVRVVRSCALTCSPPPTTDTAFEAWRERGIPVPHFRRFARFHRRFATPGGDSSALTDSSRRGLLPRAGGRFLPRAKLPRDGEASLRGHAPAKLPRVGGSFAVLTAAFQHCTATCPLNLLNRPRLQLHPL
jgi:hypothetical protein